MFSTGAPGGTFDEVVKFADTYTLEVAYLNGRKHISHAYHTHDIPKHIPWINFIEKNKVDGESPYVSYMFPMKQLFFLEWGYPLINIFTMFWTHPMTSKVLSPCCRVAQSAAASRGLSHQLRLPEMMEGCPIDKELKSYYIYIWYITWYIYVIYICYIYMLYI